MQTFLSIFFKKLLCFCIVMSCYIFGNAIAEEPVSYSIKIDRDNIYPGEIIELLIDLKIKENFYIYSSNPNNSLSPTYIELYDSSYFASVGILLEPKTKKKYDSNFEMDIGYHTDKVVLKQKLQLMENLQPGEYKIEGMLYFQACDPTKCIPFWNDFSISLELDQGAKRDKFFYPIKTSFEDNKESGLSTHLNELDELKQEGLLSFIFFALGMGFLALLTPCVFPMIPITVSFFTKLGEEKNSSPIFAATIYTLGIIIIFTGLGLVLALTLGAAGANQIASSPWINLFIALLFIYFAFSLFGHYEIQLPSAMRQFSLKQEQKGGMLGILFMALTFTLTSFTCTVQFVGLLLVAASQGSYFWPSLGMLTFATAFASPFFFLALFPQYLSKLPQSGGWLNSVKVTMGFLELGAAMKFLSNVDLVWQWGIFTKPIVLSVWVIISIMMGLYLLGKIKLPHDSDLDFISVPRLMLSIIFISFGLYLSAGLFGQSIHGLIDSYLPPEINNETQLEKEEGKYSLNWINDFEIGLNEANRVGKPIFIDFTGYTCTNCRWMETNVFIHPEVEALFEKFVLVKLFTDGGPKFRENQQMEITRFGTAALPFYVVLDPDDNEISRFHGMDTDVNKFIKFLKNSLSIYNKKGLL